MVTRRLCLLSIILSLLVFSNLAFALEGAGPDDVYGGPSQNRNICTPYHFIPEDRLTLSYDWLDGGWVSMSYYWTQGNNISQLVTSDGLYNLNTAWQSNQLACVYPRGSGFKMIKSQCIFESAIGEFNAREPKDTIFNRSLGGNQRAGRIPTDMGYREDLMPSSDLYLGRTNFVHVSTYPSDVADWPEEFRDESGEPVIISNEDVVLVHWIAGYAAWSNGRPQQDARSDPWVEMQGRVMSFAAAIARDIQFYDYKLINKSQFHYFPDVGPYDVEEYMYGPGAIFTLGDQSGDQRIAYIPKYRLGFTYEETFSDPAIEGSSPIAGYTVIKALESPDPETGELEEGILTSFSANVKGGSWGYYYDEMGTGKAWKIRRGDPEYIDLQDPGLGDDPESEVPIISRATGDQFYFCFYSDNPLCPGDTTNMVYALVCAFPSVEDPAALAGTPEGLASVASQLVQNTAVAYSLYNADYPRADPPVAPNITLIPGDRQVTITWDDISESSRDNFYDYYGGTNDYHEYDFQGYRVYRLSTEDSQLIAEFDLDTGLQYNFTDTGLWNTYPYYYTVTAYDWNGRDISDPSTIFSLESPIDFGPDKMVIPTSNPDAFRQPLISEETKDLVLLDGSGDSLSTVFRDIPVEGYWLMEGAIPTNALSNPYIFVQDAQQTYVTYYIIVDSIVGEPDEVENPATVGDYVYKLMNRIYLRLVDQIGRTIVSDSRMIKSDVGISPGHGAHLFLHPDQDSEVDIPFNLEFDIPAFNVDYMVWNDIEVTSGTTPPEHIELLHGYNNGSNSMPIGYRAADIELRWHEIGDSLTLEVWDFTHNVEIPYRGMPGSSWSFFSSWSRFARLSSMMRSELTESEFSKAGSRSMAPRTPSTAGSDVKFNLFICGMQIKVGTPEATIPRQGDVWLIRSNYGGMPAEGTGFLSQVDNYGDPLIRPPVPGVRYMVRTGGTGEAPSKSCDFTGDGNIAINDVITFLLLARDNPDDPRVDWNEDGRYTIADAINLLIDVMQGTCPDVGVLLATAGETIRMKGLSAEDISYIERMMTQMNLTAEQEAAFRLALYGAAGSASLPKAFSLAQNVPNPFNPSTTISYTVPEGAAVKVAVKVYNIRGSLVRTLVDEVRESGAYTVFWDGSDDTGRQVSSGVFFYRMQAGDFVQTRKMVLLK